MAGLDGSVRDIGELGGGLILKVAVFVDFFDYDITVCSHRITTFVLQGNVFRTTGAKCQVSEYLSICAQCVVEVHKSESCVNMLINPTNYHPVSGLLHHDVLFVTLTLATRF